MITELGIKNYKSIFDNTMELSNVNVLIGENGCGKTNILEAVAMVSVGMLGEIKTIELDNKGVRIARPSLTLSSFSTQLKPVSVQFSLRVGAKEKLDEWYFHPENADDIYSKWNNFGEAGKYLENIIEKVNREILGDSLDLGKKIGQSDNLHLVKLFASSYYSPYPDYLIYNLETQALRGLTSNSKTQPLGINGEGLDILLSDFSKEEWEELLQYNHLISWLEEIIIDKGDKLKFKGHKLGRSNSVLYFRDKYMRKNNNVFAAENSNEGILHVLFYLALVISKKTPKFFAIDNIETALNPRLCRVLMRELAALAIKHDKQILITTHNPAILDGINLHEDRQRLFVVARNDEGHTVTKRIKLKPETKGKELKLSELWMRGYLGGLPQLEL